MNKINYDALFNSELSAVKKTGVKPKLLMHACCAPCSSACILRVLEFFDLTLYFYNPNVTDGEEYYKRYNELKNYLSRVYGDKIKFLGEKLNAGEFYSAVTGLENIPEGGERCFKCYELRLDKTALAAKNSGFDYFTTTLSVSPYKNAAKLNELGGAIGQKYGVKYLFSDFKKGGGYLKSVELSDKFGLYRQDYCGCEFSKKEAELRRKAKENGLD